MNRGRGRIGVLVPFTNTNLEPDMALLAPEGVSVHVARMGGYDADRIPDSEQMAGFGSADLDEPLRLLAGVKPDVILYGCTSATLAHGPAFDAMLAAKARVMASSPVVTAAGAVVAALKAIGAEKIGFASPYVPELNDRAVAFLAESGIETINRSEVSEPLGNDDQGALTPDQVFALGRRADHGEAQAILLSCTDMRAVETLERLEADLGKPVISSNQALLFAALPHLGLDHRAIRCGRLFRLPAPA